MENVGRFFLAGGWRGGNTPPKFYMEPENDGFQKEFPFPGTSFQVPAVKFHGVYQFLVIGYFLFVIFSILLDLLTIGAWN